MRIVLLVVMLVAFAGCMHLQSVTRNVDEAPRMIEVVSSIVPIGTPVDEAQRFMEREGFKCKREQNAGFLERKGLDYIYCERTSGFGFTRDWRVAVVHRNGKVVEVLANTWINGI
jgi:hypothetical protein